MLGYMVNGDSLTVMIDSEVWTLSGTRKEKAIEVLADAGPNPGVETEDAIRRIVNLRAEIVTTMDDRLEMTASGIRRKCDGRMVDSDLTDRVIWSVEKGLPVQNLWALLNRLEHNQSMTVQRGIDKFIARANIMVTPEGDMIAYKGVTGGLKDCHTKSIDNSPGARIPRMKRMDVDDDPASHCSHGYHVGSLEYARGFGQRTVIVKVRPEDIVCVPNDHSCEKMRVSWYRVIEEMPEEIRSNGLDPYGDIPDPDYDDDLLDQEDHDPCQ